MKLIYRILPLVFPVMIAACSKEALPPPAPRLVKTLVVGEADQQGGRHYSGEVRARHESLLGFRIAGKVVARLVDAGARVKAGQPLARLDPADPSLQSIQADAQRSLAEAELRRYRDLRERNFISQSALDAKETAFKAADAQASLAKNQSAYTVLTADHDGVISETLAEPGQVVAAGQPVVKLARAGEREVAVSLPEASITGLTVGAGAEISLWTAATKPLKARLRELSPAADPQTRLYPARFTLIDPPAELALGLSADVRLQEKGASHILVPLSALIQNGDKVTVWVVDRDNRVSPRAVTVARFLDEGALLTEGLAKGEVIVAAGGHKLHDGETVRLSDPGTARP